MGLVTNFLRSTLENPDNKLRLALGAFGQDTGVAVNENKAMQNMAVYNAVRILSEAIASLPLKVYRRMDDGSKEEVRNHYLWNLLHEQPNEEMNSFQYRETKTAHIALWGNGFSQIIRQFDGTPMKLLPLHPSRVDPERENGRLRYPVRRGGSDLQSEVDEATLDRRDVFHIPGLSFNGRVGFSPVRMARRAIGISIQAERYGARFFKNDASPGGVLQHPGHLDEPAKDNLRNSWNKRYEGTEDSHKISVLEEGMEYKRVGIPPDDAQFLESRQFQIEEIARWFNIPPHFLKHMENATFSNIEQQSLEFLMHTLRPWIRRFEDAINTQLVLPEDRGAIFAEFNVEGVLRADSETRSDFYQKGLQNGWLSPNDIREKENMNPIEGGDRYFVPLNLMDLQSGSANADRVDDDDVLMRSLGGEKSRSIYQFRGQNRLSIHRRRTILQLRKVIEGHISALIEYDSRQFGGKMDPKTRLKHLEKDPDRPISPVKEGFRALSRAVLVQSLHEIGETAGDGFQNRLGQFVDGYFDNFIHRYRRELEEILEEADSGEDIESVVFEFGERRARSIASRESFRLGNAAARAAFTWTGVDEFRWQRWDDSPYCRAMEGETSSASGNFLASGETLQPDQGDSLRARSDLSHPPLFDECECLIIPEDAPEI